MCNIDYIFHLFSISQNIYKYVYTTYTAIHDVVCASRPYIDPKKFQE